jgi:hypothetical protein
LAEPEGSLAWHNQIQQSGATPQTDRARKLMRDKYGVGLHVQEDRQRQRF